MYRYFKKIDSGHHISAWKSKGLYDENIEPPTTFNNSLTPSLNYFGVKIRVKFDGSCLKQDKITFIHEKINLWDRGYDDYPTLENSLFGAVKSVKNVDIDKCNYSEYGIGFDRHGTVSIGNEFGKNVIIFGVDRNSSVHVDKRKKIF